MPRQKMLLRAIFENYSEKSIKALIMSQQEARWYGCNEVNTEHLFSGIVVSEHTITSSIKGYLGFPIDIEKLRTVGKKIFTRKQKNMHTSEVAFSLEVRDIFKHVEMQRRSMQVEKVIPELIVAVLIENIDERLSLMLKELSITREDLLVAAKNKIKDHYFTPPLVQAHATNSSRNSTKNLDEFCRDLTKLAREGKIDPLIGRQTELDRVIQIVNRRTKNNPCLIGEPGVGKTAIAEGLAYIMVHEMHLGLLPKSFENKRMLALDIGALMAGTKERGELEQRLTSIIKEVTETRDILMIDEIHMLVSSTGGTTDDGTGATMANIMKPALARGQLQCLGATTIREYRLYIEGDSALERRFQPVFVNEPSADDALNIIFGLKQLYERYHKVTYDDTALIAAVYHSNRYIRDRQLPDKAIDLIDEAGSRARMLERDQVTRADIEDILSDWTGIPVRQMSRDEASMLLNLRDRMNELIIGQPEAIEAVCSALQRSQSGLRNPERPVASLLFVGLTGVGKTELAKVLAREYYGSDDALIRLDMSEYMEPHSIARLVGAPPGYVGYNDGGKLTEAVRRKPHSIILFDEIEKAHPDVYNILLQVLDDGRLTDSTGRLVHFKDAIILITSNIGTKTAQLQGKSLGTLEKLTSTQDNKSSSESLDDIQKEKQYAHLRNTLVREVSNYFRPELVNRFDEIVVFRKLSKDELKTIAQSMISVVQKRLSDMGYSLMIKDETMQLIIQDGYEEEYGARPMRRAITKHVEDKLADILLNTTTEDIQSNSRIEI